LPDPRTDRELVDAILGDDAVASESAQEEFVSRFEKLVYSIAMRGFRLPQEDANDVFQDVFIRLIVIDGLSRWDGFDNLAAYVAKTTKNQCIDHYRRVNRIDRGLIDWDDIPDEGLTPHELFELKEQRRLVDGWLETELSERDRDVTRYHSWGFTHREIAEIVEISVNHVGVILNRSTRRLREASRQEPARPGL
jgi:RNA polymerase sigma factor (sigma-70 family)